MKLLLLAPDTEKSAELDAKLVYLLNIAREKEIPTVVCLNKRKLGKAVQMSMKQSVLGKGWICHREHFLSLYPLTWFDAFFGNSLIKWYKSYSI